MLRCIFIDDTGFKKIKAQGSEFMNVIYSTELQEGAPHQD